MARVAVGQLRSRQLRYYYRTRAKKHIVPNKWGGRRIIKFSPYCIKFVGDSFISLIQDNPFLTLKKTHSIITQYCGLLMSMTRFRKIVYDLGFTDKKPIPVQRNKFKIKNIIYYYNYLQVIRQIPKEKLIFADETHFVQRDLVSRRGWSPKGVRIRPITHSGNWHNMFFMVNNGSTSPFFYYQIRSAPRTNNHMNFLLFICYAIKNGFLKYGCFLVIDNAPIHKKATKSFMMILLLSYYNIKVIFLPKYSPELNPCENVFSLIKSWIRRNRESNLTLLQTIQKSFSVSVLTKQHLQKFYEKCIDSWGNE